MNRARLQDLQDWLNDTGHKPLVLRGARQVGKTWLVRRLAEVADLQLIEINFEKRTEYKSLFEGNDVQRIIAQIEVALNIDIDPATTLLFLDEIQAIPELLAKLRWFYEDMPALPVIAAGSLLEFTLARHSFSMPVGRISYMHLEPLSFEEFLSALGNNKLVDFLRQFDMSAVAEIIHLQLIDLMKTYLIVGGMPAAVAKYVQGKKLSAINKIHHELIGTYRDDFAKYAKGVETPCLDEVMLSVPQQLGQKFVYSKASETYRGVQIKQALNLLVKARLCHKVVMSASNGIPLGAELNQKFFKAIFIDVGLVSSSLGLNLTDVTQAQDITLINRGSMAEQIVGQMLRTIEPSYIEPVLYYWAREKSGAAAEIDYVLAHGSKVIPIEVKAGSTGGLKSLHQFMSEKQKQYAVRINGDYPSLTPVTVAGPTGEKVEYTLLSLPFYLAGQLHRLIEQLHEYPPSPNDN